MGLVAGKPEKMKLAASILLTVEGLPFMYYGEEVGMFGSKPDEDIRLPFPWGNDPLQSKWRASRYEKSVIPEDVQQKDENSILTHYKRLIRLRTANEALYAGKFSAVKANNPALVVSKMESTNQSAIVIHNLSKKVQILPLDFAGYQPAFIQTGEGFAFSETSCTIMPESSVVVTRKK